MRGAFVMIVAWLVIGLLMSLPSAEAAKRNTCQACPVCPDLQSFYAAQMAERDQERAARKIEQDRPEATKPARTRPDSDSD